METESDITVRHNADGHRYELLDGDAVIGEAHYLSFDGADEPQRIFYHTTVDDACSGQGLASKLARGALDGTIADGKTIVPVCPYIKSWLGKHDDYQPHATAVRPTHLQALSGMNR